MSYSEAWQLSPIERETLIKTLNRYNKIKSGDKGASYDDWEDMDSPSTEV